ncbi:MAG: hypothetical protein UR90_C0002G0019 [Parcubacteria group bacterium GW2011_GWC1_35_8]|uniref:Uncharacterized protein n=2 Tax=Candidatus Nomuraibacteriota TaxID=1752729 RepID=A0A1F6YKF8_9BACT|nr:MAG: hypothetical protein UR90_C0002G0019 [Parcubacteria group bacterium GW2011_GWC1_35_8]KKP88166.1 MAG: hypothetical protein UR91_C0025G0007 [Candidatus Nomurabacteria bacterium GW2011_GWC2_35_8]OGJ06089.1 MAG: hypothetical protein A2238_00745 [Candidatus Nomurabacteria bacterium RIFOXYA2_FULL_35_9]OGJ06861.1 MAG: hypothetical protein A2192_01120 [Candidatus Nomurabacteria bacterium RIFOXYA1_FULL_35_17]OGJ14844.1 MAG: hypothetical protein A2554_00400 [Candidatus Nomurabacteria bacterium RI
MINFIQPERFNKTKNELPIRVKREEKFETLNALDPEEVTDTEFRKWCKNFIETRHIVSDISMDEVDVSTYLARKGIINYLSK